MGLARFGWTDDAELRKKAHRNFGYFATFCLLAHMGGALNILYKDVVHHSIFVQMMLFSCVVMSLYYILGGIWFQWQARKHAQNGMLQKDFNWMHRTMMFYGFVHSIEGSGTIRFTAWLLWIVAKFMP